MGLPITLQLILALYRLNTDNRLLASAARIRLEPILDEFVSPCQRGFLPGRSLLANVVDVDEGAMEVSLTQERGALFLFDFRAAFPSVSHRYVFAVLSHLGIPAGIMRFLRSL